MKKLFFAAMALATIVSCSKNVDDVSGVTADGQTAFISVSLKAAGEMTRVEATNPESFQYGSTAENTINNATFYFFDAAGKAYDIDGDATVINNAVEVITKDLVRYESEDGKKDDNIEAYSNVILVIKESQNTPPAKMVAIINTTNKYVGKSLAELQAVAVNHTEAGFVMSNSVYEANGAEVVATEILPENIFTSPDPTGNVGSAYQNNGKAPEGVVPVQIYVERVAAKVKVNVNATNAVTVGNDKLYPVTGDNAPANTYVKVLGWDVTNAATTSYLIKDYATTTLFSPVNNAAFHRSYWANTIASANPTHGFKFTDITKTVGSEAYYNENTLTPTNAEGWYNANTISGATKASQLIVAAQLVDEEGNAKEFARWYGKDYENGDALKANMINNAAKQIFVKDEENSSETELALNGIGIGDVTFYQCEPGDYVSTGDTYKGDRRYEVRVKATDNTVYYKADGSTYTTKEVTAILANIEPAMIWASGHTYYYTLINHYGDADGMVRNHIYDITISGFKGIGTPVYNPDHKIIPEIPVEQEAYHLTAQINVLSWALVSQNVELGF